MKLNLGCGVRRREGFLNVDYDPKLKPDRVVDLFKFPWPFPDASCDEVLSEHLIEHVPHVIPGVAGDGFFAFVREVQRVLKPGGVFVCRTPSWRNRMWVETDPTHVRAIWPRTWDYVDSARLGGLSYAPADGLALELTSWRVTGWEPRWGDRLRFRGLGLSTHLSDRLGLARWLLRRPTEVSYVLRRRLPGEPVALLSHARSICCAAGSS